MYSRISSLIWFQMSVDQKGNMNETGRWRGVWLDVERGRHWGAGGFQLDPLSPLCIQLLFPAVGPVGKSSPRSTTRLSGNSFHRLSVSLWLSHWSSRMCLWKLQLCASGGLVRNSTLISSIPLSEPSFPSFFHNHRRSYSNNKSHSVILIVVLFP